MGKAHKYVTFERDKDEPHEFVYTVYNKKGQDLGKIFFRSKWNRHIFEAYEGTFFDWECMKQISEFLHELDNKKKEGKN